MEDNKNLSGEDLGGLQIPPAASQTPGASQAAPNLSASAEHVRQRKQRSDAGKPRGARGGTASTSIPPLSQVQFAQLYNPELWAKALGAPGDAMAAITGRKHWEISEKERQALGATGSIAAQCFAVTDPRWLAVSLCLITILDVYGVRVMLELAERKREADEKKRKDGG